MGACGTWNLIEWSLLLMNFWRRWGGRFCLRIRVGRSLWRHRLCWLTRLGLIYAIWAMGSSCGFWLSRFDPWWSAWVGDYCSGLGWSTFRIENYNKLAIILWGFLYFWWNSERILVFWNFFIIRDFVGDFSCWRVVFEEKGTTFDVFFELRPSFWGMRWVPFQGPCFRWFYLKKRKKWSADCWVVSFPREVRSIFRQGLRFGYLNPFRGGESDELETEPSLLRRLRWATQANPHLHFHLSLIRRGRRLHIVGRGYRQF